MSNETVPYEPPEHVRKALAEKGQRYWLTFDPSAQSVMKRASEIARERGGSDVTLSDVLHAMLFRRVQPLLVGALYDAGQLAADGADDGVMEVHLLLALMAADGTLPQILPAVGVEHDAFVDVLQRSLEGSRQWSEIVRASQAAPERGEESGTR